MLFSYLHIMALDPVVSGTNTSGQLHLSGLL